MHSVNTERSVQNNKSKVKDNNPENIDLKKLSKFKQIIVSDDLQVQNYTQKTMKAPEDRLDCAKVKLD